MKQVIALSIRSLIIDVNLQSKLEDAGYIVIPSVDPQRAFLLGETRHVIVGNRRRSVWMRRRVKKLGGVA